MRFGGASHDVVLYPDDPVFMVKQRIEAALGVPARAQRLFVGGGKGGKEAQELVQPLALLGDASEVEVRSEAEAGEPAGPEEAAERARFREVADILALAAAPPPGVDVGGFRFSRWRQEVPPPARAPAHLEALYHRALVSTKALVARLVTWRGGEPSVLVKFAAHAGEDAVAMARGYVSDAELGDVLELVVAYADAARVARVRVGPTGAYAVDAEAAFDGVEEDAVAAMQKAVGAVARALGLRAPDAEADALDADLDAELRTAGRRPPDVAAVRAAVDGRLFPFFAAEPMPKALRLRYKRVAGFDGRANVRDWIAEHAAPGMPPDALAAALRRTFLSLTAEEAREEAARVARDGVPRKARRARGMRSPWHGVVEARLALATDFFGYRLSARSVTSLRQWRSLARAAALALVPASAVAASAAPSSPLQVPDSFDDAPAPAPSRPAKGAPAPPRADAAEVEGREEERGGERGDVLKRLYEADGRLFQINGKNDIYARHCGRHELRQPVVVRGKAAAERAGVQSVAYGSSPEKAAVNAYACPAIWCPQSGVALTPTPHPLFDAKTGERRRGVAPADAAAAERAYQATFVCPNARFGERPMFLYDSEYWSHNPAQGRHLGFNSTRKNADGMCLPCCFKLPKPAIVAECTGREPDEGDEGDAKNDRYVLGAGVVPLKPGRYGALPSPFGASVDKGFAQTGRHLLRWGIPRHHPDSLVAAIAAIAGFPTAAALVDDVRDRLTPTLLLQLENGRLLMRLLGTRGGGKEAGAAVLDARAARAARAWLGPAARSDGAVASARDAALWRAFGVLMRYLRGRSPKDPRLLYDLVARLYGFSLAVFEFDGGRLWFDCPAFVAVSEVRYGMVLKQGAYYEPLVVADMQRERTVAEVKVARDDPAVAAVLEKATSECRLGSQPAAAAAAALRPPKGGPPARAFVLRRDLLVVARQAADGLVVPIEPPLPSGHLDALLAASPGARVVHLEDLGPQRVRGVASQADVARALRREGVANPAALPWAFDVAAGAVEARCLRPVGPSFYAVPGEDDRTRWAEAEQRDEAAYQAWKRATVARERGAPSLRRLAALAPRARAATWAPRLSYELATGRDLAPTPGSAARPPNAPGSGADVQQSDIDSHRYSHVPV